MAQGQDGPKLKTPAENTYRYVTLVSAHYAPSSRGYDGEVKLVGNFETEGAHSHWYAAWKVAEAMCAAGVLQQNGDKFAVVPGQRISFIYAKVAVGNDGGGSRHDWTVTARDAAGAAMGLNPYPAPIEPGAQATPAAAQPQAQPAAAAQPQPGAQDAPEPTAAEQPPDDRAESKTKRGRQELGKADALYGLCLVVAAYQQVRIFNVPAVELDAGALQAGAATMMIRLERLGYDGQPDRRPSYLKRLRRLEYSMWPDRCPDPDTKTPDEPKPVSMIPGAKSGAQPAAVAADGMEIDEDLPF